MNYTLWSKGTMLGRVTPFFPIQTPDTIMAYFHPADAWDTTGASLAAWARELPTIMKSVGNALKSRAFDGLEEPERTLRMQQALIDDPGHRRMRELRAAADALALELRDERGRVVPCSAIHIMASPLGNEIGDDVREAMAGFGIEPSDLMLVATSDEHGANPARLAPTPPSSDR